jgi:RNA polymerase sigma-70 factor (ECF subfamily)
VHDLPDADEHLVNTARRALPGDHRAFETLVARHRDHVITNCRCITRSPSDAEDLAQDVFVKIYFALDGFEGRSSFRTWMRRIKLNHCINWLERQKHRRTIDIDAPGMDAAPGMRVAPEAEQRLMRADIQAALDAVPDTLRVPLVMRDLDQLSYEVISEMLGISLSATKMRIKRGREAFRAVYSAT